MKNSLQLKAYNNRNEICLMGGQIAIIEMKIRKKKPILISDMIALKRHLHKIDKYDKANWHSILKKQKQNDKE